MLCTVHDAILFEFPIDLLDVQVRAILLLCFVNDLTSVKI